MNITLKFLGLGYNNINQADVFIYDCCNNLVCNKKTYNNKLNICLDKNKVYKIVAKSLGDTIESVIYTGKNNNYCFRFSRSIIDIVNEDSITFLLTDYYYDNLPIERGEMILWQR